MAMMDPSIDGPARPHFHWVDYIVFLATIVVSLGIGVYFACAGGKQKTNEEYLMGDRNLKVVPVALSILVSFVSSVGILGIPAEMYAFGTQFSMYILAAILGCIYGALIFVPLLYPLKLTSSFEYFSMRFNSTVVRLMGTFMMLLNTLFSNGVTLYAPSSALEAVTGFPVWLSIILCGISTTFYTTIGGMKAVIWTDVFQSVIILVGLIVVVVVGIVKTGGLGVVWHYNQEWGRIQFFDFDPDPTKRTTFWSIVVMMSILWMCMTAAQMSVQRYCALPTMRKAQLSILLNIPGFVIIGVLSCLAGVVAFAYYAKEGCDPMSAGYIQNPNQILPYFVMDVIGYPGIPGIFVACLYSGSISTVSSTLNSMAAITWEDLLKGYLTKRLSPTGQSNVSKGLVCMYGALSIAMSFVVMQIGGTFIQILFTILGTTVGPIIGMFILGGLIPKAGMWGAILGAVLGWGISGWMSIGAYIIGAHTMPLPLPYANCPMFLNRTLGNLTLGPANNTFPGIPVSVESQMSGLYRMYAVSYLWYPAIGITTVLLMGALSICVPYLRIARSVPRRLLFPCIRPCAEDNTYDFSDSPLDDRESKTKPDANKNLIYKPKDSQSPHQRHKQLAAEEKYLIHDAVSAI